MKRSRKQYAEAVKAAVDEAVLCRPQSIGAKIEELVGAPLPRYPDEIMSLHVLPTIDGFKFIGWSPDFEAFEMEQSAVIPGKRPICIQVGTSDQPDYIVGWKPIRIKALAGRIA